MERESKLLIAALRSAVAGDRIGVWEDVDWVRFVSLARVHHVEALACYGIKREPQVWEMLPDETRRYLVGTYRQAVYIDVQFDYLKQQIRLRLERAGVRHIFLKGAVLKRDYPVPALRTMCDLDVLVCAGDLAKIEEISRGMGGKAEAGDGNHKSFVFPGGIKVEFHPNLLHHDAPVGTGINPGWQYAKPDGEPFSVELTQEGVYLHTICHLAEHFVSGGVGVRFVLDVWVNRYLRKPAFDPDVADAELRRLGLLAFARNIEALADCWFGGDMCTPLLSEMGEYILTSGAHGTGDRAMLNAVALSPGKNRISALWKKTFYSREEMEDRFIWLRGRPWLMPAAWCLRVIRAVVHRGPLILKWGKGTGFTREEVSAQREKLAGFGIISEM